MDKPTVAVPARALAVPPRPAALVVILSGSGAGANPVRSRAIAHRFQGAGLATLAFELLTPAGGNNRLDVPSQAERLVGRCAGSPLAVRRATEDFTEPDSFAEALETAAGWFATHAVGEEATCVPARR